MNSPNGEALKWVAHELHDGLLPWVHAALMQLSGDEASDPRLKRVADCLKQAINEGRALMAHLDGISEMPQTTLAEQIRLFATRVDPLLAQQNQTLVVQSNIDSLPQLETGQAWVALRIIQQAVHNAVQHAGPTEIRIATHALEGTCAVEIIDSGRGFDATVQADPNQFGLVSMRQRANSIGGRLDIETEIGAGTTVRLFLPKDSTARSTSAHSSL